MEEVVLLQAPLVVDLRSGKNWGEMYSYGQKDLFS
jgi:DNA polymerase I-like protein with 3'-5' exonuclease and polymerase domains